MSAFVARLGGPSLPYVPRISKCYRLCVCRLYDAEVIEGRGRVLAPGLVDMRVFVGEPGYEHRETIATATMTSDGMKSATADIFAAFEAVKGGAAQ